MLSLLQEHGETMCLPREIATPEFIADYNRVLDYAVNRRKQFLLGTFDFLVKNKYLNPNTSYTIKDSIHNHIRFTGEEIIHRKGSTELIDDEIVIPLSMSRGCLIVKPNVWSPELKTALYSCSHGAGRKLSRTDTLKYWYSLKKSVKDQYKKDFSELLNRSGEFGAYIQEFDFAYKDSNTILSSQSYLIKTDETKPIVTVKFVEV